MVIIIFLYRFVSELYIQTQTRGIYSSYGSVSPQKKKQGACDQHIGAKNKSNELTMDNAFSIFNLFI